jgi:hypothetical protein
MEVFDKELNEYHKSLEESGECMECGVEVQLGKRYCCFSCLDASNR